MLPFLILTSLVHAQMACYDLLGRNLEPDSSLRATMSGPVSAPIQLRKANLFDFNPGTAAHNFMNLAHNFALLRQTDQRLNQLGLIVPDGGLCGPTSVANIFSALLSGSVTLWHISQNSPVVVETLVDAFNDYYYKKYKELYDARRGTYSDMFTEFIASHWSIVLSDLKQFGRRREIVSGIVPPDELGPFDIAKVFAGGDRLMLAGIYSIDDAFEGNGHAIAILAIDPIAQTISYSDPNNPNDVLISPYLYKAEGEDEGYIQFLLPFNGTNEPVELTELVYFELQ